LDRPSSLRGRWASLSERQDEDVGRDRYEAILALHLTSDAQGANGLRGDES